MHIVLRKDKVLLGQRNQILRDPVRILTPTFGLIVIIVEKELYKKHPVISNGVR